MSTPSIVITSPIPEKGIELLRQEDFNIKILSQTFKKKELIEEVKDATGIISMLSDPFDREVLESCHNLKVISNYAVGYDNIDIHVAKSLSIKVGNTPDVLTEATAELTMGLILAATRNFNLASKHVSTGKWKKWEPMGYMGPCLKGKTLGILGMGRIGRAVAHMAHHGFNMNVIHYGRRNKEVSYSNSVDFNTLLSSSDFLSLHCPLNNETKNLFNKKTFYKMKKGSWFFNTARGGIHCETSLYEVLLSGHLMGAGLDVTNPEPMDAKSALLTLDNCLILPHIGSATLEARSQMSVLAAQNIINGVKGTPLLGRVVD